MGQLPTAKDYRDGHFVFVLKKFAGMVDLEIDVMLSGLGTNPYLLEPSVVGVRLVLVLAFFLLVLELAIVHDPADRRLLSRSDLYQIEAGRCCNLNGLFRFQNAKLLAIVGDDSDWCYADLLIDPLCFFDLLIPPYQTMKQGIREVPVESHVQHLPISM